MDQDTKIVLALRGGRLMRIEDDCNFCLALLDAHCAANGEQFCKLKEEYLTTDISADAIMDKFYSVITDEQLIETDMEVRRRMGYLNEPVTNPDQAAAQKWLHNYQYGKG